MSAPNAVAVFDVGKTNKKLLVFDEDYNIVYEQNARFRETVDADGFPCEDIDVLKSSLYDSLKSVLLDDSMSVKAVNYASYGASLVLLDDQDMAVTPICNYLKPFPPELSSLLYEQYGGKSKFLLDTASPSLGSLNSGLQIFRLKRERPDLFSRVATILHLPQFISFLVSGRHCSEITSIGCHTAMWHFQNNDYHPWVPEESISGKLPPVVSSSTCFDVQFQGHHLRSGVGLHDSSAALIPYLKLEKDPFVLITTGTWSITLSPFNDLPLTMHELDADCLSYLSYEGRPVKASRLFLGHIHDEAVAKIASHFNIDPVKYRTAQYDPAMAAAVSSRRNTEQLRISMRKSLSRSVSIDVDEYASDLEAYYALLIELVDRQILSSMLVLPDGIKNVFVDGGFSKNEIFMNLLASRLTNKDVFATCVVQGTALGAAMAIRNCWNGREINQHLLQRTKYSASYITV